MTATSCLSKVTDTKVEHDDGDRKWTKTIPARSHINVIVFDDAKSVRGAMINRQ